MERERERNLSHGIPPISPPPHIFRVVFAIGELETGVASRQSASYAAPRRCIMRSLCAAPLEPNFFPFLLSSFLPSFFPRKERGSSASWEICREESTILEDFGDWDGVKIRRVLELFLNGREGGRRRGLSSVCWCIFPKASTARKQGGRRRRSFQRRRASFQLVGENTETRCSRMLQFKIAGEHNLPWNRRRVPRRRA